MDAFTVSRLFRASASQSNSSSSRCRPSACPLSLLPGSARLFFYLPDFSALWGYFFFIAREKWGFGRLRRRRERSPTAPRERSRGAREPAARGPAAGAGGPPERPRGHFLAGVGGPSRYDEREIRVEPRRGAARVTPA